MFDECYLCVGGWHELCDTPTEFSQCCCYYEPPVEIPPEPEPELIITPTEEPKEEPIVVESEPEEPESKPVKKPHPGRPPGATNLKTRVDPLDLEEGEPLLKPWPGKLQPKENQGPTRKAPKILREPSGRVQRPKNPVDTSAATGGGLVAAYKAGVLVNSRAAGRRRAALIAPITDGKGCEWAGLKYAGGGVRPITGCRKEDEKLAKHVHHGPDKAVMNNDPTNLHRVCYDCHNRWHTLNDDFYGVRPEDDYVAYLPKDPYPCIPHDKGTLATEEDFKANEKYWSENKARRARD